MRLRDSLSNPPKGLKRLVVALEQVEASTNAQVKARLVEALVEQTGAENAGSVRLEVKENRKLSPPEVATLVAAYQAGINRLMRSEYRDDGQLGALVMRVCH